MSACIVAPPAEYEESTRTPPIFDLVRAKPFIGDIIVVDQDAGLESARKIQFNVPVRSEDQGEEIIGAVHIDYGSGQPRDTFTKSQQKLPASTLDDVSRVWDQNVTFFGGLEPGCHQVTLIATHRSNWDDERFRPIVGRAEYDTAIAMWWMIYNPNRPPTSPVTCPSGAEIER
ncbi:MAG TPA: hypothetical protein VFQ35_17080 [Polyangiaceae bacterium]|nr:hypothetical protein [Polyangiaceae bacterium]